MVMHKPDSVTGAPPMTGCAASTRGGGDRLSVLVVALALIGFAFCAGLLLFVRFAHWAGAHPFVGTLLIVLAIPVLYVALRAMPRAHELRRAARAGMAQADRELGVYPADVSGAVRAVEPDDASTPGPWPPDAVHDGLTVELHHRRADFG
ncbi:hypothetical protein ACFCWV_37675 [Streptomyces sp. NPDC056341]|uniref:hypothetical protein n=1 Tax=Streptomyces sp. NPDC056341 TaxID=3345788 RepID=UPI0035DE0739